MPFSVLHKWQAWKQQKVFCDGVALPPSQDAPHLPFSHLQLCRGVREKLGNLAWSLRNLCMITSMGRGSGTHIEMDEGLLHSKTQTPFPPPRTIEAERAGVNWNIPRLGRGSVWPHEAKEAALQGTGREVAEFDHHEPATEIGSWWAKLCCKQGSYYHRIISLSAWCILMGLVCERQFALKSKQRHWSLHQQMLPGFS